LNEKVKSSEPALWTFAGIVIPMDEPLTVPVPSLLNVRIPSDVNDCPNEPSVGVRSGLNPGPGAAVERQAFVPVNPYSPFNGGEPAAALAVKVATKSDIDHKSACCMIPPIDNCPANQPSFADTLKLTGGQYQNVENARRPMA